MKSWNDDASVMDNRAYYNKESSNIWYREGEFLAIQSQPYKYHILKNIAVNLYE